MKPNRHSSAQNQTLIASVPREERRRTARPTLPEWPGYSRTTKLWLHGKRGFDVASSTLLLLLCSPVFAVLCVVIPLTSSGPIFFRSKRRGLYGRSFEMLKFRTMVPQAHQLRECLVNSSAPDRVIFKLKQDPRITPLGRLLRKFSVDELPQLFNVLRGHMSLIGPRPLLKEDFESTANPSLLFRQWVRDRHGLRPGITGLWQVSGRSDLPLEQSMQLDLHYVTQWIPWLDIKIIFKTPLAILAGKGAY